MKIGEQFLDGEGSKFVIKETHDFNPTLKAAEAIRQASSGHMGDSRHVGRVPGKLFYQWLKEAGVSPTDTAAAQEVIKRKMLDGEFSQFRIWQGTY